MPSSLRVRIPSKSVVLGHQVASGPVRQARKSRIHLDGLLWRAGNDRFARPTETVEGRSVLCGLQEENCIRLSTQWDSPRWLRTPEKAT